MSVTVFVTLYSVARKATNFDCPKIAIKFFWVQCSLESDPSWSRPFLTGFWDEVRTRYTADQLSSENLKYIHHLSLFLDTHWDNTPCGMPAKTTNVDCPDVQRFYEPKMSSDPIGAWSMRPEMLTDPIAVASVHILRKPKPNYEGKLRSP